MLTYVNYDKLRIVVDPDGRNAVAKTAADDEGHGTVGVFALI